MSLEESISKFIERWQDGGDEKQETALFWTSLLQDVLEIDRPTDYLQFEKPVKLAHKSYIDVYLPNTRVLVEQKSSKIDLDKEQSQSDGFAATPYEQAKRYAEALPLSEKPRFIITCNFLEFRIYDQEQPQNPPFIITLKNLAKEAHNLNFIADAHKAVLRHEFDLSIAAGDIVGELYNGFLKEYHDPNSKETLRSLNILCVRLVFCLYAEDAGIFGKKDMFLNYLQRFETRDMRRALIDLFKVLDTKDEERDPYLDDELASFPYVNGGLFAEQYIEIPNFTDNLKELLLTKAAANFDWSGISPTIFGAVFESTLNQETRRNNGMHYTSIENIHKVIDPLFLDDLKEELAEIRQAKQVNVQQRRLEEFRTKLANLTFLDPACGSGNFLTETYLSLRQLENESLLINRNRQIALVDEDIIKVKINQFYGIEINDFAVTVARTALWIAESQMMKKTKSIVHSDLDFLPLKSLSNIVEGNALRLDWNDVVPKEKLNYIMGNPPFVGGMYMTLEQKNDIKDLFGEKDKGVGELDYVGGWYRKAQDYMDNTLIKAALVSTNSICQGEHVSILWKSILQKGMHINYAYRTFQWDNEANKKNQAHVHCIIVGFSYIDNKNKILWMEDGKRQEVNQINGYLCNAPDLFVDNQGKPLCGQPKIIFGNMPRDGGGFILTEEERKKLIENEPISAKWIHEFPGATEFINNKKRYCLWLQNASPSEIVQCPTVKKRIESVKQMRLNSKAEATRKLALSPTVFAQITQPLGKSFIIIPRVSSQNRKYIPMGFMSPDVIASDATQIIPDANIYHLGILTSLVHMAWMRTVCGRLKSDYRYSNDIVYNNFPWPTPTDAQKAKIEQTAQAILDARALYPDSSLADLYDETNMPIELRKAHQANDKAVMDAYGFKKGMTEPEIVAELFKMYKELIDKEEAAEAEKKAAKKKRSKKDKAVEV